MFATIGNAAVMAASLSLLQISVVQGAYIPVDSIASRESSASNTTNTTLVLGRRDISPPERARLDALKDSFKGIWWDEAYPGAAVDKDNGECTLEQFNIIAEATRMAIELARYDGYDPQREDAYFHRFFVRNRLVPPGGRWTSAPYVASYGANHHNLLIPSSFPITGKGSLKRAVRVTYRCKDYEFEVPGTGGCKSGIPAAYTLGGDITETGTTTIFCPKFFAQGRYLNDIAAGPPKTIGDFGDPRLLSYEQMIVHEWMHADVMGYNKHIEDVEDALELGDTDPVKIYGMSRARDYAWKFMRDPCCPHVNPKTVLNADNYAWYFANKYYANLWHWNDDGTTLGAYDFNVASPTIDSPDNTVNASTLSDVLWPSNCTPDPSPIVLDSVNITINCVLEGPDAPSSTPSSPPQALGTCVCNEDGCTPESPPCCGNGTC